MASLTSLIIVYTEPYIPTLTLLAGRRLLPNLMRINLQVRNSWCSTKITNDDGHHFVAATIVTV